MPRFCLVCLLLVSWSSLSICPVYASDEGQTGTLVWPPTPGKARVEFQAEFKSPEDLGLKHSFGRKLKGWLAGEDERGMSRPYAVAASTDRIVVADPDAAVIHIFSTRTKRYKALGKAGKEVFVSPIGVALDGDTLFVADSVLKSVFVFDGKLKLRRTINGFERPTSVAFSSQNERLYVADTAAHEIQAFDAKGVKVQSIGKRGTSNGQFNFPSHIAVSGDRLLVNDTLNFRIQLLTLEGEYVSGFGRHGLAAGWLAQSKGVGVDSDGHIFVADARANWIQVFDQDGTFLLVFGSEGSGPGAFNMPTGLTFLDNTLYVADSLNQRVQVFRYLPEVP